MIILQGKKLHQNFAKYTSPVVAKAFPLPRGKSTSKILWLLAYRKNGRPRRRFSTRGPLSRNSSKENYEKKSDYKRNSSSRVYLRASNWSIIPSPLSTATSATSLTHRKYGGWEPPMCREPKSGALYSTDFPRTRFPRNARVGAKKNFILNTFSPFSPPFRIRESAVSALRTIRQQFLIFPLLGQQIDPPWKFRRFNPV